MFVYRLSDPLFPKVGYVGRARVPGRRLSQHWQESEVRFLHPGDSPAKNKRLWLGFLRAIGVKPTMEVRAVAPSSAELWAMQIAEHDLIAESLADNWYLTNTAVACGPTKFGYAGVNGWYRQFHEPFILDPYVSALWDAEDWPESYMRARLKRDAPEIAARINEFSSIRAAAKEAGIISNATPLVLVQRAWGRATQDERHEIAQWVEIASRQS
jgi:hypothetical protein